MKKVLQGIPASPGIGIGKAQVYRETEIGALERTVENAAEELERYRAAVGSFCALLEDKADRIARAAGQQQADIIRSQVLMVRDPYLNGQIEGRISSLQSAESAVSAVCGRFIELFQAADNELTKLRAADVRDLRDGMLRLLLGLPEDDISALEPGTVLVADELSPSAMTELDPEAVAGIVLRTGGRDSHCAILARALEIPTVVGAAESTESVENGEWVVVDGVRGYVLFSPPEEELPIYRQKLEE